MSAADGESAEPAPQGPEPSSTRGFALLKDIRPRLLLVAGLALLAGLATVVPFIGIVRIVRALLELDGSGAVRVWTWAGIVVLAVLVRSACVGAAGLISHTADNELQLQLRRRIVAHIRRLPLGWLDSRQSSGVVKAVEHDVDVMHQLVGHTVQDLTLGASVPLISLVYLLYADWRMALAALVPVVLAVALMGLMMSATAGGKDDYERATAELNAAVIEFVRGIAVVKAFGQGEAGHGAYRRAVEHHVSAWSSWMRRTGTFLIASEILTSPVFTLLVLTAAAAWLVGGGTGWLGVLPGMLLGLGLAGPVFQLATSTESIMDAAKAHAAIVELLEEPVIPEAEEPQRPAGAGIEVERVGFSYAGGRRALHEITLHCPAGSTTALVGPSGSGKSTLARLIPRFYDVSVGAIRIGGADVRRIGRQELYGSIAMVFQEPYLLRASIRDNICLTRPDCPEEEMIAAARAAQVHDTITGWPAGYGSVIGQDAHVSGGEAQRLSIARALVADAPILILDEATAFADPDSEALIQQAISALAARRTIIVIAHRLHTITGAERIVVLDRGSIVEQGTHEQLTAAGGPYARLWAAYDENRGASA